jgi:hypothetical protein
MSLAVTVYVPAGIVIAADSRTTLTRREERDVEGKRVSVEQPLVLSDNANKVITLHKVPVGMATYGAAVIQNRMVDSHVAAFEEAALAAQDDAESVAGKLVEYFREQFAGVSVGFYVAGYRSEADRAVPYVFHCNTTREPYVKRINQDDSGKSVFGVARGGDTLIANRLIAKDYLPIFSAMPLQDAVDYAIHLIRTTIDELRFEPRFPSVGGAIDVLVITPSELRFVQRKELHGLSD